MKHRSTTALAAALAAASFGLLPAARAQQPTTPFVFTGPGDSSVVHVLVGGQDEGVYAGRYHATIGGVQSNIFCTDFSHEISTGDTYAADGQYGVTALGATGGLSGSYYNGGLASALNASDYAPDLAHGLGVNQRVSEVAWLTDNYLGATTFTFAGGLSGTTNFDDNLAGVNLAIWDIVQDGGTGLGTGQVQLTGSTAGYFSGLASYYEGLAAGYTSYASATAEWIQAPRSGTSPYTHKQDYVTEAGPGTHIVTAVPEPSSVAAFALTGFGAAGLMLRARRRLVLK